MSLLSYLLFRFFTFPLEFLPYSALHKLGRILGWLVFHGYPKYRKRALSNLALATDLHLSPEEIRSLALRSIQSMSITAVEYPRLSREKDIHKIATCDNPEEADAIMKTGKGIIFFCGHQANWELLFLEGTSRMPGVAIGRPIKNKYLYRWVMAMRQKFGGTIIEPKNAYREAMRGLRQGKFVGVVGDQGMPDSGFSAPFLGREAWTSPLPAMLSKRSGCPIMTATIRRQDGKYRIHYSAPIWPTQENQMEQALALFQTSIKERPHEWLWTHNKWKQQPAGVLKKQFRHDAIALIFQDDPTPYFSQLRDLYPREQITAFVKSPVSAPFEVKTHDELFLTDYRFKLVVDFTNNPKIHDHFNRLSALQISSFKTPEEFIAHARR